MSKERTSTRAPCRAPRSKTRLRNSLNQSSRSSRTRRFASATSIKRRWKTRAPSRTWARSEVVVGLRNHAADLLDEQRQEQYDWWNWAIQQRVARWSVQGQFHDQQSSGGVERRRPKPPGRLIVSQRERRVQLEERWLQLFESVESYWWVQALVE